MGNKTAFGISILVFIILVAYSCKTTSGTAAPPPPPPPVDTIGALTVSYNSPWLSISLENRKITSVKTIHHYAENNFSSVPDSMSTETLLDAVAVSDSTMNALFELLDEQKFWDLEEAYGAPDGLRYYPYEINAEMPGKSKKVIFRSNPSFDLAPQPFRAVESFLKGFEGK